MRLFEFPDLAMAPDMRRVIEAIQAFQKGEIVVVTDDGDRENEGDLFVAASLCTPEKMAFIIRHTSGIVCAPMPRQEAARLRLAPMVADNDAPLGTAFTVSVDYRPGLKTGISADERCSTVRALANPNAGAADFVRPGHVFPLIAKEGGVLIRSGHTEACVDLCRLATLPAVGVLAELVNDNGAVMRGEEVSGFAKAHGLKLLSVADLIAYRQRSEKLVQRAKEFSIRTPVGPALAIAYRTPFDSLQHLALVFGEIGDGKGVPVRLHLESVVDDVFGRSSALDAALARISAAGRGIVIYLREGSMGVAMPERQRDGDRMPADETASEAGRKEEWREIGLGAQILRDLGVHSIRLLSTKTRHYVGVEGFGITIEATEAVEP